MNSKILVWALVSMIFLLCFACGYLIITDSMFRAELNKTFDMKADTFTERVAEERQRIKQEMDERFRSGMSLFADAAKNLEDEKKRSTELKEASSKRSKK